jgi:tetratricopeptide (TPR) repeat protein
MAESHREEIAKLEALYASSPGGRVFVHLAEALRKAGDYERARGILSEGLGRHSDSASGYVVLGRLLTDLQADSEAEDAFRRVLQLDGGNLIALRGLADLALRGGRRQEAAGYYTDLLARNPAGDDVRHLLAELELGEAMAAEPVEEAAQAGTLPAADEAPLPDRERDRAAAGEAEYPAAAAASFSAAPGDTGEVDPAEPEFGFVELDPTSGAEELDAPDSAFSAGSDWGLDARDADLSELLGEEAAESTSGFDLSELRLTSLGDDDPLQAQWQESAAVLPDSELAAESIDDPNFGVIEPGPVPQPADPDEAESSTTEAEGGPSWPDEEIEDHPPGDLDETAPDPAWGRGADDGLVTETMADLYRSQGFHDRAADMYRALLRQRPADAALLAKLQAAETAQRIDRVSPATDLGAAELDDDGTDSWLHGLGAWTESPDDIPDETPYAWTPGADGDAEPERTVNAAPAIGEYLRELISWMPRGGGAAVDAAAGEKGDGPGSGDLDVAREAPGDESHAADDPWTQRPAEVTDPGAESAAADNDEPWAFTPEDKPAEVAPVAPDEAVSAASEPGPPASDPWHRDSMPVDPVEAAFNEWYLGDAPAAAEPTAEAAQDAAAPATQDVAAPATQDVAAPATQDVAAPATQDAAAQLRPPQAGLRLGDETAEDQDEDEDLAMFRAWLQSLKK